MILVCGEALFDLFLGEEHEQGFTLDARIGGSPFNVAVGLARLGLNSSLMTGLSEDWLGTRLLQALKKNQINTDYIKLMDRPTTISLVGLDQSGSPSYAFYGENAADRSLTPADAPEDLTKVKAIHIGSYSTVVAPMSDAIDSLLERAKSQDIFVSFDPNIRPTVEPNIELWRKRVNHLSQYSDLLKISNEDLDTLYPDTAYSTLAKQWLTRGVSLVVITHGSEGAEVFTQKQHLRINSHKAKVIDTVGAGDSFQAALLVALAENKALNKQTLQALNHESLNQLLDFASQVAGIVVSRRGADIPFRDELPMVNFSG